MKINKTIVAGCLIGGGLVLLLCSEILPYPRIMATGAANMLINLGAFVSYSKTPQELEDYAEAYKKAGLMTKALGAKREVLLVRTLTLLGALAGAALLIDSGRDWWLTH